MKEVAIGALVILVIGLGYLVLRSMGTIGGAAPQGTLNNKLAADLQLPSSTSVSPKVAQALRVGDTTGAEPGQSGVVVIDPSHVR